MQMIIEIIIVFHTDKLEGRIFTVLTRKLWKRNKQATIYDEFRSKFQIAAEYKSLVYSSTTLLRKTAGQEGKSRKNKQEWKKQEGRLKKKLEQKDLLCFYITKTLNKYLGI